MALANSAQVGSTLRPVRKSQELVEKVQRGGGLNKGVEVPPVRIDASGRVHQEIPRLRDIPDKGMLLYVIA